MPRRRLTSALALICAFAALTLATTTAANGALVIVGDLVLHADGGFQPRLLPRHRFAPIDFQGYFDISAKGGGAPVPLQQAVVDFDRDGRLSVGGLPTCAPEQVENADTAEARQACAEAIVGTGRIEASVASPGGSLAVASPLTIFNGPSVGGGPTAVLHARIPAPAMQTFAIEVPIERRRGAFRYRAVLDLPPIAGGLGAITRVQVKIGRRFSAAGRKRSYVSARCSDGILQTHGRFTFGDGTIVDGSVEKACTAR
jgi:hypothetical protein